MRQAGINREETLLWNTIPWWNGTRAIRSAELAAGLERLDQLFSLLPKLTTVIGVGSKAARTKPLIIARGLAFYNSAPPLTNQPGLAAVGLGIHTCSMAKRSTREIGESR